MRYHILSKGPKCIIYFVIIYIKHTYVYVHNYIKHISIKLNNIVICWLIIWCPTLHTQIPTYWLQRMFCIYCTFSIPEVSGVLLNKLQMHIPTILQYTIIISLLFTFPHKYIHSVQQIFQHKTVHVSDIFRSENVLFINNIIYVHIQSTLNKFIFLEHTWSFVGIYTFRRLELRY